MKFPVLFRVFAALNILGFLALLVQTALFFSKPSIGLPAVALSAIATIWVLIASFLWFFGSRHSYALLYLTALVVGAMGTAVVYASLEQQNTSIFFNVFYGAVILIYCTFLLVSCFYKPIKEWNAEAGKSPTLSISMFALLVVLVGGGLAFLNTKLTKYLVLSYPEADPFWKTGMVFDLDGTYETDALVISTNLDVASMNGRIYFADSVGADEEKDFFHSELIHFEPIVLSMLKDGESFFTADSSMPVFLGAKISTRKAKRIVFMPEGADIVDKSFALNVLHSVPFFGEQKERTAYGENYDDPAYADEYYDDGDAAYYESEAAAQEIIENKDLPEALPLSAENRDRMISDFFQELVDTYEENRYYFNTDVPHVIVKSKAFGYYNTHQQIFRYKANRMLYNQIGRAYPEEEQDFTFNDLWWKVSGRGVYLNLEDQELPFYGLNPAFIKWLHEYMVPEPGSEYLGQTSQALYDGMFRRAVWQLATAREYFESEAHYEQEAQTYLDASREQGFYGPGYLYKRYMEGVSSAPIFAKLYNKFPPTDGEYFYFTEEVALGFWLRRRLDGSDDEVWTLLKTVLEKYDTYPFEPTTVE